MQIGTGETNIVWFSILGYQQQRAFTIPKHESDKGKEQLPTSERAAVWKGPPPQSYGFSGRQTTGSNWPDVEPEHHRSHSHFQPPVPCIRLPLTKPKEKSEGKLVYWCSCYGSAFLITEQDGEGLRVGPDGQKENLQHINTERCNVGPLTLQLSVMKWEISNLNSLTHSFNNNPALSPYCIKELCQFLRIQRNMTPFLPSKSCSGEIRQIPRQMTIYRNDTGEIWESIFIRSLFWDSSWKIP